MTRGKSRYYDKRQIIRMSLVQSSDFTDRVLVCIPKFAWDVARSFLSVQGAWRSTYAMAYHDTYYETPSDEEFDEIQESISNLLVEGDMSCDLEAGLQDIADQIARLVAKECGAGCGGSGGAGVEPEPIDTWEDDGTDYPEGFVDRDDYLGWKCKMAQFVVDRIEQDLKALKDMAITELSATILAGVLLTPIPLDDIAVLVGVIITYAVEDALDDMIDSILLELGLDNASLLCKLYNSISAGAAILELEQWADTNLSEAAEFLFKFFVNNDVVNQLFTEQNLLVPDKSCVDCVEVDGPCYEFENEGTLLDWEILTSQGTVSLDNSNGGLTAKESGAGLTWITVTSPENIGYEIQSGDIWYVDTQLAGGIATRHMRVIFTDATDAYILTGGNVASYARKWDSKDLSDHAGKVIDRFEIYIAETGTGERVFTVFSSCFNAQP